MKMTESVSQPASLVQKEVRRIVFADVKKADVPELYTILRGLFGAGRQRCKLWVCIGRHDCWFDNEKEYSAFMRGFLISLQLINNDEFLDMFGDPQPGHPKT